MMSAGEIREKQVQYVGLSDIRIIRKADWAIIGVDNEDVVWNRANKWAIPVSQLSAEVLNYCQYDPELVFL